MSHGDAGRTITPYTVVKMGAENPPLPHFQKCVIPMGFDLERPLNRARRGLNRYDCPGTGAFVTSQRDLETISGAFGVGRLRFRLLEIKQNK